MMNRIKDTSEEALRAVILNFCEDDEAATKRISEDLRLLERLDSLRSRAQKRGGANSDNDDNDGNNEGDLNRAVKHFQAGNVSQNHHDAAPAGTVGDAERVELEEKLAQAESLIAELETKIADLHMEISENEAHIEETVEKRVQEMKATFNEKLDEDKAKNKAKLEQEKAKLQSEYDLKLQQTCGQLMETCGRCGKMFVQAQNSPAACVRHPGAFSILLGTRASNPLTNGYTCRSSS